MDDKTPNDDTIIDFMKAKTGEGAPFPQYVKPDTEEKTKARKLLIKLEDTELSIEGYVGLTASFLAVGDKDGNIKFAANGSSWKYITDVTDVNSNDKKED